MNAMQKCSGTKERPILFSAPMVLAILAGTKTQTRRIMKPQPTPSETCENDFWFACNKIRTMVNIKADQRPGYEGLMKTVSPYDCDRLWVRETFATLSNGDFLPVKPDSINSGRVDIRYRADDPLRDVSADIRGYGWRPSIFMPRWASRIDLEITDVRVERLQEINEADAKAEGIIRHGVCPNTGLFHNYLDPSTGFIDPRDSYKSLWESINGVGSWDANPWVWVIEFKRCEHE